MSNIEKNIKILIDRGYWVAFGPTPNKLWVEAVAFHGNTLPCIRWGSSIAEAIGGLARDLDGCCPQAQDLLTAEEALTRLQERQVSR